MKGLKCLTSVLLTGMMAFSSAGCSGNFTETGIAATINNSVTMPDQYRIVYEVESANGVIFTVEKAKDSDGNVYYKSEDEELLFLVDGTNYIQYEKNEAGAFVASDLDVTYNADHVALATDGFMEYAEKSKEKFMPGMKNDGEQEKLGRTCRIYSVSVGTANTAVTYTCSSDKETGICLGWDETKKVVGNDLDTDSAIFTCTEFITEDVLSLKTLIDK